MAAPLKTNNISSILVSGMVKWNGPDIPCIGLCNGDTVNEVVYKLANLICSLVDDIKDLATLNYSCVIDLCNNADCSKLSDPDKVSLKLIFQTLLNNDCSLNELIIDLDNKIKAIKNNGLKFNLNLECIEAELIAICKSTINYSLNDLLQAILNVLCETEQELIQLQSSISTLNNNVETLTETVESSVYEEPILIDDCSVDPINGGEPTIHSEFTQLLANKVCDIMSMIGTQSEFEDLVAASGVTGITTYYQNEINQWNIINNLKERIELLEEGCCGSSCENINIAFNAITSGDNVAVTITSLYIPYGYSNCNTVIQILDNTYTEIASANVTLSLNEFVLDVTGSTPRYARINYCYTNGEETCNNQLTVNVDAG